jgi:hypothetical protein
MKWYHKGPVRVCYHSFSVINTLTVPAVFRTVFNTLLDCEMIRLVIA